VVSIVDLNARRPGMESHWGTVKFIDGICKYLPSMSFSYVENYAFFVVSVCIELRHFW